MTSQDWTYILGQLDGKMDLMLETQRSTNETLTGHIEGHGKRIQKLEQDHAKVLGAAAVIAAACSAGWQWIIGNK